MLDSELVMGWRRRHRRGAPTRQAQGTEKEEKGRRAGLVREREKKTDQAAGPRGKRKWDWAERKENDPKDRNFDPKEDPEKERISEFQEKD